MGGMDFSNGPLITNAKAREKSRAFFMARRNENANDHEVKTAFMCQGRNGSNVPTRQWLAETFHNT